MFKKAEQNISGLIVGSVAGLLIASKTGVTNKLYLVAASLVGAAAGVELQSKIVAKAATK